jgi:sugar transferase (PEP-CTERM/EpsH1 system associated)
VRILIISNELPYPPISGGRVRAYSLLRRIAKRHQVWLATHIRTPGEAEGVHKLQEFCQKIVTGQLQRRHPVAHLPGLLRYALAGWPLELKFHYSRELANEIRRLVSEVDFHIVQIEESSIALYLEILPPDMGSKYVMTFYDIDFDQFARIFHMKQNLIDKWRTWLYSRMMRRWEPRYAERFDRCIVVSERDRSLLTKANPRLQVNVIPNGVDTRLHRVLPLENSSPALLFIGNMSYLPSIDAVMSFCDEILPHIRRSITNVTLWIVGADPTSEVLRLNGDGIRVTGRVPDVTPYYRQSSVCVVPLRSGGGTRLKILEAMALGRPVVSTTIGCEGLDVVDGEHLLIADGPEQFAEKTVRLLTDRALYKCITSNARQLVATRYDWDMIAEQLMQVYTQVMG